MTLCILGTGKMGGTLGRLLAEKGYKVIFGSRDSASTKKKFEGLSNISVVNSAQAIQEADTVIIAIPWAVALSTIEQLGDFEGKTVIDVTMPMTADISSLVTGIDVSASEEIAKIIPKAKVVKSFNLHSDNLSRPDYCGETAQLFYCGDDIQAKETVRSLISSLGFEPVDVGLLNNARWIDAMGMLWIQLAFIEDFGMDFCFKIAKA